MPSTFPGMDPYLEGQVWEEFHASLMVAIRDSLVPSVRPRYIVRLEERMYVERVPEGGLRMIRPDVAVIHESTAARPGRGEGGVAVLTAPIAVPLPMPEEVREVYVEIRLRESAGLVTVVEALSPDNKRSGGRGRRKYLVKRDAMLLSSAHLVEIDLLRGGERLPMARPLPPADYYVIVSREPRRPVADVWPFTLRQPLPTIPIPLADGDPDVPLNLQDIFTAVYDRAGYDYSLDYRRDPEPPLSEEDMAWAGALLTPPAAATGS
jgi:hypothetical protein